MLLVLGVALELKGILRFDVVALRFPVRLEFLSQAHCER